MTTEIRYLLLDGTVGTLPYSGEPLLRPVWKALNMAGVAQQLAVARVLTDESPTTTSGQLYGCHVPYTLAPAALADVAQAYEAAGLKIDDKF